MLQDNLNELIERKVTAMIELQSLRDKINNEGAKAVVDKFISIKKSMKELEREENEVESVSNSELDAEVLELEEQVENGYDGQSLYDKLDRLLSELEEELDSAKKEFAARLRTMLAVQRKIDDVPCQSELIQYDHRLSELNAQIQGKLRQTRKYYATYNALLEIKEMMLKEASLLNSISSQFQDAITSADGRMKLINSMEGIMKGSEQKLKKVEQGFQEEQKICDALKAKHVAATAEQRRCYSLLKAFSLAEIGCDCPILTKSSISSSILSFHYPVVVPKIDPIVYAFQEFLLRWQQQYRRRYPDELLDKSNASLSSDPEGNQRWQLMEAWA